MDESTTSARQREHSTLCSSDNHMGGRGYQSTNSLQTLSPLFVISLKEPCGKARIRLRATTTPHEDGLFNLSTFGQLSYQEPRIFLAIACGRHASCTGGGERPHEDRNNILCSRQRRELRALYFVANIQKKLLLLKKKSMIYNIALSSLPWLSINSLHLLETGHIYGLQLFSNSLNNYYKAT